MDLSKTDRAYFRIARTISEMSDFPRQHLGCVVVDKHRIISSGYNSGTKCDAMQARLDMDRYGVYCPGKVHAECSALLPLIKGRVNLKNASIYIYREHKDGTTAIAKPCPSCMKLIKKCGIKKINYTTEDGYIMERLVY